MHFFTNGDKLFQGLFSFVCFLLIFTLTPRQQTTKTTNHLLLQIKRMLHEITFTICD